MQYYYLDGLDKKGPYTKEELKGRDITSETLVFSEGMESWKQIKDISDLNTYLFLTESLEDNETKAETSIDTPENVIEQESLSKNEQKKIKIPSIIILFLSFGVCIAIAYFIASLQKQKDFDEMNKKIDAVFKGKTAITDYNYDGTNGQLYDVYLSNSSKQLGIQDLGQKVVRTQKRILAYEPLDLSKPRHYTSSLDSIMSQPVPSDDNNESPPQSFYETGLGRWKLYKDLVQYYEGASFSGFEVVRLEKNSSTFTIIKSWSGDMAYKVPESKHFEGYSSDYYTSPGYDLPTYRPSIGKCYEEAAKYLTVEKEDKSYEAGSYVKISSVSDMETKFFEITQRYPRFTRLLDKIKVDYGKGLGQGDVIDNYKITKETSATDSYVYNAQWIVWYKSLTNTYSIEEKEKVFNKYWLIYSAIGVVLVFLIFFFLKYRKRISIN